MKKQDTFANYIVRSTDTLRELAVIYTALILLASASFSYFEGMHYWDSVWMSVVTSTSTGYGDFYPKTIGGRITGIVLMISAIFVVIPLVVARLLSVAMVDRNQFTHEEQEEIKTLLKNLAATREPVETEA